MSRSFNLIRRLPWLTKKSVSTNTKQVNTTEDIVTVNYF